MKTARLVFSREKELRKFVNATSNYSFPSLLLTKDDTLLMQPFSTQVLNAPWRTLTCPLVNVENQCMVYDMDLWLVDTLEVSHTNSGKHPLVLCNVQEWCTETTSPFIHQRRLERLYHAEGMS